MTQDLRLICEQFPRSNRYHPDWIAASVSGGANSVWLTEWLTQAMDLRPGMRILDLGCGRAASSVFLRREFGVEVWATDLWFSAAENLERIRDAGLDGGVYPINADARALPFAADFFDAVICIDSYVYFGTDDLYLGYLAQFVKADAAIGIAGAGLMQEFDETIPDHLQAWWSPELCSLHSSDWWRRHWQRSAMVEIDLADDMPHGWRRWLDWQKFVAPDNRTEIETLERDRGKYLGYVRVVGRRRSAIQLQEPIVSIPAQYTSRPLLRDPEP